MISSRVVLATRAKGLWPTEKISGSRIRLAYLALKTIWLRVWRPSSSASTMSSSWANLFMLTHSSIKSFIHGRRAHVEPDWLILVLRMAMSQVSLIHLRHTTGSHVRGSLLRLRSHMRRKRVVAHLWSIIRFSLIPSLDHILGNILIINFVNLPFDTVPLFLSFQWGLSLRWSTSNDIALRKAWTISSWRWLSFFPFFLSVVMVLVHRKAWLMNIVNIKFTKTSTFVSKVIWSKFITLSINFIWIIMVVSSLCRCQEQLLNRIWTHSTNSLSTWMISKHL